MNVAFIIPTGIGCSIGGHAGDATPAVKLIAQACEKLFVNPNAVNASDINEMPSNALYVEGSILNRFLRREVELQEVKSNHVLVAVNKHLSCDTHNAINASIVTTGMTAEIVQLDEPLVMDGFVKNGVADGEATGMDALIDQVRHYNYDALAIATEINVSKEESLKYFRGGGVNPWGGIEARVSRYIAGKLNKPVAHAPIESDATINCSDLFYLPFKEKVDPRMSPEVISNCYLHCVMKGLHKAPRIGSGMNGSIIEALITPSGCIGEAHKACFNYSIPVIAVRENATAFKDYDDRIIYVENYLEAAGLLLCMRAGISKQSVRVRCQDPQKLAL